MHELKRITLKAWKSPTEVALSKTEKEFEIQKSEYEYKSVFLLKNTTLLSTPIGKYMLRMLKRGKSGEEVYYSSLFEYTIMAVE